MDLSGLAGFAKKEGILHFAKGGGNDKHKMAQTGSDL
jgi:hypothetical protein